MSENARHLTPPEHYRQAEICLEAASVAQLGGSDVEEDRQLRRAQVHATLATVNRNTAGAVDV